MYKEKQKQKTWKIHKITINFVGKTRTCTQLSMQSMPKQGAIVAMTIW
jgi:hypothetical protein